MTAHDAACDTMTSAEDLRYDRDMLVQVLVYHWPVRPGTCNCGWNVSGASYPEHIADVYERSVEPPRVVLATCSGCRLQVELPTVPDRDGWVSITPLDGWTAPPVRCPSCSAHVDAVLAALGGAG